MVTSNRTLAAFASMASLWTACALAQGASAPAVANDSASAVPHAQAAPGDLSGLRVIAVDTLKIVQSGDFPAARKRMDELESRWNSAAPTSKLATEKRKQIDAAIDRAERELRFWRARRTDSVEALQELIRVMDGGPG